MKRAADIVLVQCPVWGVNMPPMTPAALAAFVRMRGFSAAVRDLNIEEYRAAADPSLWDHAQAHRWMREEPFAAIERALAFDYEARARLLLGFAPLAVGLSITAAGFFYARRLARALKKLDPDVVLIAGGKGVLLASERAALAGWIDYAVAGEGEEALAALLAELRAGRADAETEIPGVWSPRHPDRLLPGVPTDLAGVPAPDYSGLDCSLYPDPVIGLYLSKGCVGRCAFCEDKPHQGPCRVRAPESLALEIEGHVRERKIRRFWFHDLAVNADPRALEELCDRLIARRLDIEWIALAIARKDFSPALLGKMRRAGCTTLNFGVESGSDAVLARMDKLHLHTAREAGETVANAARAGIHAQPNFIVGFPGETQAEFQETLDWIGRHREHLSGVTNVNACLIPAGCPAGQAPGRFGIDPQATGAGWDPAGWSAGGLTPAVRLERARQAGEWVRGLGLGIFFSNISEADPPGEKTTGGGVVAEVAGREPEILLVHPPPWGVDSPPTGVASLASYLQRRGIGVEICDFNIEAFRRVPEELRALWRFENKRAWSDEASFAALLKTLDPLVEEAVARIARSRAPVVGFSVVDPKERVALELIRRVRGRDPRRKIVVGGPVCSIPAGREFFARDVDALVVGEGEETLREMLLALRGGLGWEAVEGVACCRGGALLPMRPRRMMADWDGFVSYDGFDLALYQSRTLSLEWSRGCFCGCRFCKIRALWPGYRFRDPESIVSQMEHLVSRHAVRRFTVTDATFNGDLPKLEVLCRLLAERLPGVEWSGQAVPRPEFAARWGGLLFRAGCRRVELGLESGSDEVLAAMGKPYRAADVAAAARELHSAGIDVRLFVMTGYPGERRGDVARTREFIEKNARCLGGIKSVNTLHLVDGTDLANDPPRFGIRILDPGRRHIAWESDGGQNTYAERLDRARSIVDLVVRLGFDAPETNLDEALSPRVPDPAGPGPAPAGAAAGKRAGGWRVRLMRRVFAAAGVCGVDLGMRGSELRVAPLGAWLEATPHRTSCYGGPDNFGFCLNADRAEHWRDFRGRAGVVLGRPRGAGEALALSVTVFDNSYGQGAGGRPVRVLAAPVGEDWREAGSITLEGRGSWVEHRFRLDPAVFGRARRIRVLLEDGGNETSGGLGKSVSRICIGALSGNPGKGDSHVA